MPAETITASLMPAFRARDADAAIDFLCDAFGFEKHAVHRDAEGHVAHAELRFGNGVLMLGQQRPDPANPWSASHGIYVVVEDVDAHHARAVSAGAEVLIAPRDTEYGSREYTARDPEGRLWSFGTYRP